MTRLALIAALCLTAGKPRFDDGPPLAPMPMPQEELPPAAPDAGSDGTAHTLIPSDPRPVVRVYTVPAKLCRPCGEFKSWLAENADDAPFRFDVREAKNFNDLPQWVADFGVPAFHFDGADGKSWVVRPGGWQGIDVITQQWASKNPQPLLQAAPATLVEQIRMFAGSDGEVSYRPAKPVRAVLGDGTVLQYSSLAGTVKSDGSRVTLTLKPPFPTVSVKALSLVWVSGNVQSLELSGNTLGVETSRGRYSIRLEKVK